MSTGNDSQHGAALTFDVAGGQVGKITYYYAKSTKGGSADLYLDGLYRSTISYKGSIGKLNDPEFNEAYKVALEGLVSGTHVLELRNTKDGVYVDRFCMESSSSSASPAAGPGNTASSSNNVLPGQSLLQSVTLPATAQGISVVAETTPDLPIQLVLLSPTGTVVGTSKSLNGVASITRSVGQSGVYVIKVVNVGVGPVQVWTATTPYLAR